MHAAGVGRRALGVGLALLVGEDRDQPAVARVEVEVALGLVVEVRLLEDERHPEHALPEVDRRLPVGADDRDVVDALALELSHSALLGLSARRASTCTRCARRLLHGTSSTSVWTTSASRSRSRIAVGERGVGLGAFGPSSTLTGSGGSCLIPGAPVGRTRIWPLTRGANELTTSRTADGKDVDAADDQHVVGAPDAAHARAGAPAGAGAGPELDVVAGAEAQQRRRAVAQVGEHELARARRRRARRASPVSGSMSSAWTKPRAPRCMPVLLLALAPERDADVADSHRLGHPRAPAALELGAEGGLAAAGLAGDQHPLDARRRAGRCRARRPTRPGARRRRA